LAVPDVRVWCPVTPFKTHPPQGSGSLYLEGIADIVADSQVRHSHRAGRLVPAR
jgi:hypothetical protein